MRTKYRNLALKFSTPIVIAGALFLASCSGGGGDDTTTPTPPPTNAAAEALANLNSSLDALETLAGAATAKGSALKMATEASDKIGTLATDGDSKAAMDNAQMVLDAKADLDAAITDAEGKLAAAKTARAGLDAGDPLLTELNRAIASAEGSDGAIKTAEGVRDGDPMGALIRMVTKCPDTGCTGKTKPKTAADQGKLVANAISTALESRTFTNDHGTDDPASTIAAANKVIMNDAKGMTFAMLFDVVDKRVLRYDDQNNVVGTRPVKAMSVDGKKAADLFTADNVPNNIGAATNGTEFDANVVYKGIDGLLACLGADCKVGTDDDQKLTGSWYLVADDAMARYTKSNGTYTKETMYASYGHWLLVNNTSGVATVKTFATSSTTTTGSWIAPETADDADAGMKDASAEYSGDAAGRSVRKTYKPDGSVESIASGRFEADVSLTATFAGDGSTLSGTVDGFTAPTGSNPDAVNPAWTVTLNAKTTGNGTFSDGATKASGTAGIWSATSYGTGGNTDVSTNNGDGRRPTGIYGGFNANFTDGHVAGAYATRKD